ncbi:MAG: ABC transporter ATP-binding protein [Desulfosporosinus sp.]
MSVENKYLDTSDTLDTEGNGRADDKILVTVSNLTKRFGDNLVLDSVSFNVKQSEFLCIVGPTGCGKTTFLNSLTKLYDITKGEILINDEPVDLKKHNISYIFQEPSTMPWLTVDENVRFGLKIKKTPKEIADQRANEFIRLVNLEKFKNSYPNQLSISMLQRVVIARSFATNPTLLLMDEPYGQLDLELRYKLEDELVALWQRTKTTVIFITHNIEEAVYLGQRILVLTNRPTKIKEEILNNMPRPRNIADPEFVKLRNRVTELIKWW